MWGDSFSALPAHTASTHYAVAQHTYFHHCIIEHTSKLWLMPDPIEMNSLLKHNHLDENLLLRLHCAMLCSPQALARRSAVCADEAAGAKLRSAKMPVQYVLLENETRSVSDI